ncbi:MAG: radical SAM protein [Candidatus Lokiarchaeota archaeon]|nr:radical SAM protein [Candidatus Lokiarchaeota archaeon]
MLNPNKIFQWMRPKWSVIFEVTDNCNLRCPFCYVIREMRLKRRNVDLETYERVLKIYRPLYLQMTGGEATIHPNFIDLIKISQKYALLQTQVSTNGLVLHKYIDVISKLKKKPTIGISLDAPNELHDDIRNHKGLFKRIVKTIFLLKEKKIPHAIACTVFGRADIPILPEGTLDIVEDTIKFCEKLNIAVNFQPFNPCKRETRVELGKKLLRTKSKNVINSNPYRNMLVHGNWHQFKSMCRYNWTNVSINSKGKRLPTFQKNCYFCEDCSKCYYSCVWEPSLLTSHKFLSTAKSLLDQALLIGIF